MDIWNKLKSLFAGETVEGYTDQRIVRTYHLQNEEGIRICESINTFQYLGIDMTIVSFIPGTYEDLHTITFDNSPLIICDYADKNGIIREKKFTYKEWHNIKQ